MKTITVLNAINISNFAFETVFNGKSALELSVETFKKISNCQKIYIFTDSSSVESLKQILAKFNDNNFIDFITQDLWNYNALFMTLSKISEEGENILYGFADTPFYDLELIKSLVNLHEEYFAEYTFADGYPLGLVPEIFCASLPKILQGIVAEKKIGDTSLGEKIVTRDAIFEALKTDINSFDIETLISDYDYRYLRYNFACNCKSNFLLCKRIWELKNSETVKEMDICKIARDNISCLKTVPFYYSVQICKNYRKNTIYLPKLNEEKSASDFMTKEDFTKLVEKISLYSDTGIINLSYLCEATYHPDFIQFIQEVLKNPGLSLFIETSGKNITENLCVEIADIVSKSKPRTNGHEAIYFVVCLDAFTEDMYKKIHGQDFSLEEATKSYLLLKKYFGKQCYPQFVRMTDNEEELEKFFRFWKSQDNGQGNIIVQKYDNYCGKLPQKKVADLRPILRNPCWQLRREMHILIDGRVPQCKESVDSNILGNAFTDELSEIFESSSGCLKMQLNNIYEGICKDCDEYYTFNF